MKTRCPHCYSLCLIRKSYQVSVLYRELTFVCQNVDCGHVFVAGLSPVRTLSPSAIPADDIKLPFSSHINKATLCDLLSQS